MQTLKPISKGYDKNIKWACEHYIELQKKYPERWVAFHKGKAISNSKSLSQLKKLIDSLPNRNNIPLMFVEGRAHVYKN